VLLAYNQLPDLPPQVVLETRAVLKRCIEGRAVLAELKAVGALLPDQAVLINTIPLLEAQASSEIENIVTTGDALFKFSQLEELAHDPATKGGVALPRCFAGRFRLACRASPLHYV
jgi:Fic family protein